MSVANPGRGFCAFAEWVFSYSRGSSQPTLALYDSGFLVSSAEIPLTKLGTRLYRDPRVGSNMKRKKGKKHDEPDPTVIREAMLEAVTNQLRVNEPPETRLAYDRLIELGFSEEEVMKYLACAVSSEVYEVMKHKRPFDRDRYVALLNRLPTLPWE